jgi:signal transduction histidine kinase
MIGRRTALVAVLMLGAGALALGAWYRSGMAAAAREGAAAVDDVARTIRARERTLADELTARLEELRVREAARPYLHYQNLFHDPDGASAGPSVTPSPLATGPADPLIALHFQLDGAGGVTSPSINDELPEARQAAAPDRPALAAVERIGGNLIAVAARGAVMVEPDGPIKLATASRKRARSDKLATAGADKRASKAIVDEPPPEVLTAQVIELAPEAYAQNQQSNAIYAQQRGLTRDATDGARRPRQLDEPTPQAVAPPQAVTPPLEPDASPRPAVAPRPRSPVRPAPVIVTVAPLVWTTAPAGDRPALFAVRQVSTPDGARTQGFTVDDAAVTAWLAERDADADLSLDGSGAALAIAEAPWRIAIDGAADLAYARRMTAQLSDSFRVQFAAIALVVAAFGLAIVVVAARGERLATQRVQFAAAAAHELRTPLAGIQLYGDMLADELGDPAKHRDYARRVAVEAARLGRVVGNVMGVSQLERGTLAVRNDRVDLVPVVRAALERAEPGLLRAGAALELRAPAVAIAVADPDAVARVLGNLLDNAEKYARDAADRTITVAVEVGPTAVTIAVRDRGPGLPPGLRRGRFRPFTRAAGDDAPPGLGLGLALSGALARAMGGTLAPRAVTPGAELVLTIPSGGHGATGSSDPHSASV